jgi:hypothetical protein
LEKYNYIAHLIHLFILISARTTMVRILSLMDSDIFVTPGTLLNTQQIFKPRTVQIMNGWMDSWMDR